MVGGPFFALLGSGGVFITEDDLEQEAEKLAGLFLVWEQEHVDAQVVEVAKVLKILGKLLARLEPASWLSQILLLQKLDVDELVFLAEHGVDAIEANHGSAAHRFSLKSFKAAHLHAKLLKLHE